MTNTAKSDTAKSSTATSNTAKSDTANSNTAKSNTAKSNTAKSNGNTGGQSALTTPSGSPGSPSTPPPTRAPVSGPPAAQQDPTNLRREPVFPEDSLTVRAWPDPVLDNLGHDPRSPYVETFWVSVVGPSCYLLLRRFATQLERSPTGFDVDPVALASELGLGAKGGRHGPFWRSLERACHFRLAHRQGPLVAVRRRVPPLSRRQIKRLPNHLASAHDIWEADRLAAGSRRTIALAHNNAARPTAIDGNPLGGEAA